MFEVEKYILEFQKRRKRERREKFLSKVLPSAYIY